MVDVGKISGILGYYWNTVGGRNPAPVENGTVNIPLFI
jgi:hypothetical protein